MTMEVREDFFEVTFNLRLESEMSMQQKNTDISQEAETYTQT